MNKPTITDNLRTYEARHEGPYDVRPDASILSDDTFGVDLP